jgi:hypothetical protein
MRGPTATPDAVTPSCSAGYLCCKKSQELIIPLRRTSRVLLWHSALGSVLRAGTKRKTYGKEDNDHDRVHLTPDPAGLDFGASLVRSVRRGNGGGRARQHSGFKPPAKPARTLVRLRGIAPAPIFRPIAIGLSAFAPRSHSKTTSQVTFRKPKGGRL